MEGVIEENEQMFFINNRDQAQKRNAVELKQTLKFPNELLALFGSKGNPAKMERCTSLHMFESSPQSKCAVSYVLNNGSDTISIILVFSVSANMIIRVLRCESEVTQMCTPGDDGILIVGTILGSLCLYDLNEFDQSQQWSDQLNYESLLLAFQPELAQQNDSDEFQDKLQQMRSRFSI